MHAIMHALQTRVLYIVPYLFEFHAMATLAKTY